MRKHSKEGAGLSTPSWETLEAFARGKIEEFVQVLLEDEVTALLGRAKSARRAAVDAPGGYRNGSGKPRRLALSNGTITVRRPRVRGLAERFESRLLPLFARRTQEVGELLPRLYLHGLAQGDFELALRGLLGEGAPLSPSSIARLRAQWQLDYEAWAGRRLDAQPVVYLWADGLYVKAGLNFGAPYPHQTLSAFIPDSVWARFGDLASWEGKRVRVTGEVWLQENRWPALTLTEPTRLVEVR